MNVQRRFRIAVVCTCLNLALLLMMLGFGGAWLFGYGEILATQQAIDLQLVAAGLEPIEWGGELAMTYYQTAASTLISISWMTGAIVSMRAIQAMGLRLVVAIQLVRSEADDDGRADTDGAVPGGSEEKAHRLWNRSSRGRGEPGGSPPDAL